MAKINNRLDYVKMFANKYKPRAISDETNSKVVSSGAHFVQSVNGFILEFDNGKCVIFDTKKKRYRKYFAPFVWEDSNKNFTNEETQIICDIINEAFYGKEKNI